MIFQIILSLEVFFFCSLKLLAVPAVITEGRVSYTEKHAFFP